MAETGITELAERLRAAASIGPEAFADVLADHWADEIEATHQPPMPGDGTRTRDRMNELNRGANAALRAGTPDIAYRDASIEVVGNEIVFLAHIHGNSADGKEVDIPLHWVYTVDGTTIRAIDSIAATGTPTSSDAPDTIEHH